MPTPSGFNAATLSNTLAGTPIWCRLSASVSPPMPPPAMSTVMVLSPVIPGRAASARGRRVGKAKCAHHSFRAAQTMVGTAQGRLCPPYDLRRLGLEVAEHDGARLVVHLGLEHELVFQRDRACRRRPRRDLIEQPLDVGVFDERFV